MSSQRVGLRSGSSVARPKLLTKDEARRIAANIAMLPVNIDQTR